MESLYELDLTDTSTAASSSTSPTNDVTTSSQSAQSNSTLMEQVALAAAAANAQELLGKMADKCFRKCVRQPPGQALSGGEQKCVAMCMDRYMDCWNVVAKVYGERLEKETKNM